MVIKLSNTDYDDNKYVTNIITCSYRQLHDVRKHYCISTHTLTYIRDLRHWYNYISEEFAI